MKVRRATVAALVLAAFICFPASAGASRHHYVLPAGRMTRIGLAGSNGYRIRIYAHGRQNVDLVVTKEGFSTEYLVRDVHVGADRVQANLPGLGSISVRFLQRGPVHRPPAISGCDGPRPTQRRGVVRGTIKFRGERDYTRVAAHQAPAEIEEWARQRCRYGTPGSRRRRRPSTNEFEAYESEGYFSATKYRPGTIEGGRVVFSASTGSRHRSVSISRRVDVVAPASTFQIPEPDTYPEHVILSPPAPFTGTGTFARTPESVFTWEGDLAVQFPGIDPIPLTGEHFNTSYCALRGCIDQEAESESGTG